MPDMEAPDHDVQEQQQQVAPGETESTQGPHATAMPAEANEADVAEQDVEVELDEDDYR